jgi:uncharacterized protein (TIGR03083 family)
LFDGAVPPPTLRAAVLNAAAATPRLTPAASDPLDVFARQVERLSALIDRLEGSDWKRHAAPYAWSVHGLLAHLLVIEEYTAGQLGLAPPFGDPDELRHLAIGATRIEAELRDAPLATAARWRARTVATISALRRGRGPAADATVALHVWPFTPATLLIARSFEVWTHADDIRRAVGLDLEAPPVPDLVAMSQASVRSLELLVPALAAQPDLPGCRVVLTGDGGATYDLGQGPREMTLVADIVDYCRLVARRAAPEAVLEVEGDRDLADALVRAAQAIAV